MAQYENSIAYHSVAGSNLEQLQRIKPYYEMAVEYWKQKSNTEQVEFFATGLCFVNKRIESCRSVQIAE